MFIIRNFAYTYFWFDITRRSSRKLKISVLFISKGTYITVFAENKITYRNLRDTLSTLWGRYYNQVIIWGRYIFTLFQLTINISLVLINNNESYLECGVDDVLLWFMKSPVELHLLWRFVLLRLAGLGCKAVLLVLWTEESGVARGEGEGTGDTLLELWLSLWSDPVDWYCTAARLCGSEEIILLRRLSSWERTGVLKSSLKCCMCRM